MDVKVRNSPQIHRSAANLKSALQKAREILSMATLSPLSCSRLQTPTGSTSDISDSASQSSDYGYSPLHGAVISNDVEYLDFLLGSGCERLDQRDENGFTALHVATLQKSNIGVHRLIKAGCDIEKPTKEGMSSLHIVVDLEDNHYLLCLLASSIPNINIRNKVGRTALHVAAKSGNQEYIEILLDFGCDREIKDKFGKKAVDIAKANGHDDCVQVLMYYIVKKRVFETQEDENGNLKNVKFETTPVPNSNRKRQEEKIKVDLDTASPEDLTSSLNDTKEQWHLHDQEDLTTFHHAKRDCEGKEVVSQIAKEYFLDEDTSMKTDNTQFFSRNNTAQGNGTSDLTVVLSPEVLDNANNEDDKNNEENVNLELNILYQNGFEASSRCIVDLSTLLPKRKPNGIYTSDNICSCLAIKEADHLYCEHWKSLKELNIVICSICGSTESQNDWSSDLEIKKREVCELKHELQFFDTSIMPLRVLWMAGDVLWRHKLNKVSTKHVNFNRCHDARTQSSDIIGQLLQGLKLTLNGKSCNHSKTSHGLNGQRLISEDLVDQFSRAIKLMPIQQENAYEMLEKFCNSLQSASTYKTLVHRIFTRSELIGYSRTYKHTTSENLEIILLAFDYILQHKKTSGLFAMCFLEFFMNSIECVIPVIVLRPEFVEAVIHKAVNDEIWDEDKVAEVFILLSDALVEDVALLCRCVDVILSAAFTCRHMNKMAVSSCILVRMGLLKSEFEVNICRQLKGALLALEHVFYQEYFPACLAGLFSSFLVKPSPRFREVNLPRKQALKAAMLKEILQPTMSLGKGLKRICDVLAQGDFWETALRCSEALVEESLTVNTTFTPMEQGSSVLVYFGLIKSEFPVQLIENVGDGLKLLRHAAEHNDIPQSIAPMLVMFFKKSSSKMHLYKEEVEELQKLLTK